MSTCKASPNVRATVVIITIIIAGEELLGLHRGDIIAQLGKLEEVLIVDVEMAMREGLREIGCGALKYFLENADGEAEAETECACGGNKLKYQRRRDAGIGLRQISLWLLEGQMQSTCISLPA